MGMLTSKASPLAPSSSTWQHDYKDKGLDFGLDSQGLADQLGGDKDYGTGMVSAKDLDAQLRALRAKAQDEERDWVEQGRKLYEFEEKFLRDTLLEGNVLTGWGEPRTAPVRFRNAGVRKRKRERQEAAAERAGKPAGPSTPTLSVEEQLKVDRHRLASYSSVQSPAEPLHATLEERGRKLVEARNKRFKKPQPAAAATNTATATATAATK